MQETAPAYFYFAAIPSGELAPVAAPLRQTLLEETGNEKLRRQRYFVWKLLEYALGHSLGLQPETMEFFQDARGKWHCRECCFSLSHAPGAVAVAVSSAPIGIDLECATRQLSPNLQKILTSREAARYRALPEADKNDFLLSCWCGKESLFKAGVAAAFQPRLLETEGLPTGIITLGGQSYRYAASAPGQIFSSIQL